MQLIDNSKVNSMESIENNKSSDSDLNIEVGNNLASRWSRLGAVFIDTIIMVLIAIILIYVSGIYESLSELESISLLKRVIIGLIGSIFFLIINGKLLVSYGQTVGKKILRIKIVTLDGQLPNIKTLIFKRYALFLFIQHTPIIGQFISLINPLFIFNKEKRCLHDLVASTKVINV